MVVVEWEVPPRTVLFLKRCQDRCKVSLVKGLLVCWQGFDAEARVKVAIIIEITSYGEPRLVGNWTLASHVEPAISSDETIQANLMHFTRYV